MPPDDLKPCPFCGKTGLIPDGLHIKHSCYTVEALSPTIDIWNNAYCWKEIDLLRKEMKIFEYGVQRQASEIDRLGAIETKLLAENNRLRAEIEDISIEKLTLLQTVDDRDETIEKLRAENERYRKALEKINQETLFAGSLAVIQQTSGLALTESAEKSKGI